MPTPGFAGRFFVQYIRLSNRAQPSREWIADLLYTPSRYGSSLAPPLFIDGTTLAQLHSYSARVRVASRLLKSDHIFYMGGVLYGSTDL
jgi:hypothetical protein